MLENREEVMRHQGYTAKHIARRVRPASTGGEHGGQGSRISFMARFEELLAAGRTWDEIVYVNFEDERLAGMECEDLNKILEVHTALGGKRPMLFLDEIQNIDGWERFARRVADSKYTVYITGSNAKMLSMMNAALGGRYMTREVFPMQFNRISCRQRRRVQRPAQWPLTTASRGRLMDCSRTTIRFDGFRVPRCR